MNPPWPLHQPNTQSWAVDTQWHLRQSFCNLFTCFQPACFCCFQPPPDSTQFPFSLHPLQSHTCSVDSAFTSGLSVLNSQSPYRHWPHNFPPAVPTIPYPRKAALPQPPLRSQPLSTQLVKVRNKIWNWICITSKTMYLTISKWGKAVILGKNT